jgi:D-alanyl-D-alanine carboxypeptidase
MSHSEPARIAARRLRPAIFAAGLFVSAMLIGGVTRSGADGAVPAGLTVFDDVPALANLDPDLLQALRRAAADAAADGVRFVVNSGWRSPAHQRRLLRQAVARHGSRGKATRWVAPPNRSSHVSGHAVDIGPSAATAWLSAHGARYGLCRIYRNEPWHYELRPQAVGGKCPSMYADPAHDPRMQL